MNVPTLLPSGARSEAGLSWHPAFLVYPPARMYGAPVQSSPVPIDVWVATVHIRRTMPSVCGDENSYFFPASSRYYITPYMYSCSCSWSYLPGYFVVTRCVYANPPPPRLHSHTSIISFKQRPGAPPMYHTLNITRVATLLELLGPPWEVLGW